MEKELLSGEPHFRNLERMYLSAPFNILLKSEIHIQYGTCEIKLVDNSEFYHAAGALHGSIIFKLLDDAAYFACSSQVHDHFILTTSFLINFHRPATKGLLIAKGSVLQKGKNLFVAESKLYSESNKLIASGTGNFAKSNMELDASIGYK